jgi:hypothetical protein
VRQEEPDAEQGHVRHAVLEAGADEGEEAPEDEHQPRGLVLGPDPHPHREADQRVAEHAAEEQLAGRRGHLRGGHTEERTPSPVPC